MHAAINPEALAAICRNFGVVELAVFGSVARGEARLDSDIDIMIALDPAAKMGLVKFQELADALREVTNREVDLVTKLGLKPWIRESALKDAKVLYAA